MSMPSKLDAMSQADLDRADQKSRKRKAAREKMIAEKTVEKGLLIVHTGKGKGKSTAAFGLVFRALGNGLRVGIIQFVKGKWETGERYALEKFGDQVETKAMGEGFSWDTQDKARDIRAAEAAWAQAQAWIAASDGDKPKFDMILLDELNIPLRYDNLPIASVVETLRTKPKNLHLIITGRNAKDELIDIADLVTEMGQVKHPFREQNVKAQRGIEF